MRDHYTFGAGSSAALGTLYLAAHQRYSLETAIMARMSDRMIPAATPQRGHVPTISLFSGCGGMDLGAQNAGCSLVLGNDSCEFSAQTHSEYFQDTEFIHADVASVRSFPGAEIVIGGYPCQSFSLGGNRDPARDERTNLFLQFARCVSQTNPRFFVAENVSGLRGVGGGAFYREQIRVFSEAGQHGYRVSSAVLLAQDFGVPQRRKRLFVVGVRRDLGLFYRFPTPTHAAPGTAERLGLRPHASHGDAIAGLPLWPTGEFYERPHDPDGHFSWYYRSRNRKAPWDGPSFTVVANWRHTPLHPASPAMRMVWSNLADGFKQEWDFSGGYEHLGADPSRPALETPRRLSWRECAAIQGFPHGFEPAGPVEKKFEQIGNAVPPLLAQRVIEGLIDGTALSCQPTNSYVDEQVTLQGELFQ